MSCINKATLAKYDERQQKFLLTAVGQKFYSEYLCRHGNHTYNISNTGGGKTQRNYWLADFLRRSENIIWLSTGKSNEILPLLFMDCKVRIIIPEYSEFKIEGSEQLSNQPEIIEVKTPSEAWWQTLKGQWPDGHNKEWNTITIFEFRNTIIPEVRSNWMSDLFVELAEWSREGTMPKIFPCAIFMDEAQWVLAGTRITRDEVRTKTSEIVTENALEMRSYGARFILSAQHVKNIVPATREQMLNAMLGRDSKVTSEENDQWARWCGSPRQGIKSTSLFRPDQARFIFDDGRSYCPPPGHPTDPWSFPLYPLNEEDRATLSKISVKYGRKFAGRTYQEEEQEELIPELGRFSQMAIPPEKQDAIGISRYDVIDND